MKKTARISKLNIFIWLALGMILSLACMGMYLSGSVNLNRFYDVGEVYNYSQSDVHRPGTNWIYNSFTKQMELSGEYGYQIWKYGDERTEIVWKYLCIEIEDLQENVHIIINYYNESGRIVSKRCTTLTKGWNIFEVPDTGIARFSLGSYETDSTFGLKNIQLRENPPVFDKKTAMISFALFFLLYMVLSMTGLHLYRKSEKKISFYFIIEGFQKLYIKVGSSLQKLPQIKNDRLRQLMRSLTLMLLFLSMNVSVVAPSSILGGYQSRAIILIFVIAAEVWLLLPKEALHQLNWRQPLVYAWFFMAIWKCISDFIYPKTFSYLGYMWLFLFGLLFFVWGYDRERQFLVDIQRAVKWYGVLNLAFCLLIRPYTQGYRYPGCFTNPNTYSMYLVLVSGVLYSELADLLEEKKINGWFLVDINLLVINLILIYRTQSRTGLLGFGVVSLIWLAHCWIWRKCFVNRKSIAGVFIAAASLVIVLPGFLWANENLPKYVRIQVQFEEDDFLTELPYASLFSMETDAAELLDTIKNSRFTQKLKSGSLEYFTSGRTEIYTTYFSNMNFAGHEKLPYIFDKHYFGHNILLDMSYRYGIIMTIPYLLIIICGIGRAGKQALSRRRNGLLTLELLAGAVTVGLVECIEVPTKVMPWFFLYFIIGGLFTIEQTSSKGDEDIR